MGEYLDNDISALNGARRPGYAAMMEAVQRGDAARIVAYQSSRLWRNRRERAEAMEVLATRAMSVAMVSGPEIDYSSAYARGLAGLLGEFDTMESEVKSERVTRASLQRAHEGRANGATPFGYRRVEGQGPGILEPDPTLGPEVAGMVRHLLDGWSLRKVADDLNARQVPTPGRSKAWTPSAVRKVAVRPGNAGLRIYQGEVIGQAAWPALVTEDEFARLSATLADPLRKTNAGNESERKHLLTYGLGACGVCGGRLRVARKGKQRVPLYVCEQPGCVGRQVQRVDDLVRDVVLARLARPDAADVLKVAARPADADGPEVDVEDLRERQTAAARAYAAGALALEQLVEITAAINAQIAEAERVTAKSTAPRSDSGQVSRMLSVKDAATLWNNRMTVEQRRSVVEWLFSAVRIMPQRPGPGFDPESVVFVARAPE